MDLTKRILNDIGRKKQYTTREVLDLLQIEASALEQLEKEGKIARQGGKILSQAWYSPIHVLRLLQRR